MNSLENSWASWKRTPKSLHNPSEHKAQAQTLLFIYYKLPRALHRGCTEAAACTAWIKRPVTRTKGKEEFASKEREAPSRR